MANKKQPAEGNAPEKVTPKGKAAEKEAAKQAEATVGETVTLTNDEFMQVKAHIDALQKEKDDAVMTAQRLQAEFDNYRKRNASLRADSYDEGVRDCIKAMLPTLDNFDRALSVTNGVDKGFVDGITLVQRTLLDALAVLGMKELEADGKFDPNIHNAVIQETAEGKTTGDILEIFQKGYEVKGKIVRHAMVKVAE
ncbi:MAG: nucleotide exchange factor GrpE [Eubacteriales bacterium]|nr:nucleotide exchange factor GrpE [Eubacteriales bacterium]